MSDGNILSVQEFIGSLAACALAVAMTQAGWTHRWFVRGMFALSAMLAICAIFWGQIGPVMPPLDQLLSSASDSRLTWFVIGGALVAASGLRIGGKTFRRAPEFFLERDPSSGRYGIQIFPGVTYVQFSAKAKTPLEQCKIWISKVEYRESDYEQFAEESNERHQIKWARPNLSEIDIKPEYPSARGTVAIYATQFGLAYDPPGSTPSNLYDNLQRLGTHRFTIVFSGEINKRTVSSKLFFYLDWRGPSDGAIVRIEPCP